MRSSLLASACAQSRAHRRLDTCAPPSPAKQTANKPNQHERMPPLFSYRSVSVQCTKRTAAYRTCSTTVVHTRAFSAAAGSASTTGCAPSDLDRIRRKLIRKQVHVTSAAGAKSCAVTAERHRRKLKAKLPTAGNVHAALHSNSFGLFRLQRQVRWQPQPTCNTICYGLDFGHSATRSETSHRAAAVLGTSPLAAAPAYRRERDRVRGVQVARRGVEWRWCGERSRPW